MRAFRSELVASMKLGGRKHIQSVKSVSSICIQSLKSAFDLISVGIIEDVKRTHPRKHTFGIY